MWIIIATVCSSLNATDCVSMVWKSESFITEQLCLKQLSDVVIVLPTGTVAAGCFPVPGQSSV